MGADLYRETTTNDERLALVAATDAVLHGGAVDEAWHAAYDRKYGDPLWYFRDSYNDSNLLWRVKMHYWGDASTPDCLAHYLGPAGDGVLEQVTEDGETFEDYRLHPAGCRRLAAELRRRSELLMYACRDLPDVGEPVINIFGHEDRTLDKQYFSRKFDQLLAFLDATADAGDTIFCSV